MKKSLVSFIVLAIVCLLSVSVFAAKYSDINNHWAEKAIERWSDEGILKGYTDNTFRPDNHLSRAEYVSMIVRIFEPEEKSDLKTYTDLDKDAWYYENIEKAVAMGFIQGYSNTRMGPNDSLTRQDAIVMLDRILTLSSSATGDSKEYTDADKISSYARNAIKAFTVAGYLNGYEDGSVRPDGLITRAEIAQLLHNSIGMLISKTGEYDLEDVKGSIIVFADDVTLKNADDVDKVFVLNDVVKETLKADDVDKKDVIVINSGKNNGSSGRTSRGGSTTRTFTITLTDSGDQYSIKKSGTVSDTMRVVVIVNGKKLVNGETFSRAKFADLKIAMISLLRTSLKNGDVDADMLLTTAENNYAHNPEVRAEIKKFIASLTEEKEFVEGLRDRYLDGESLVDIYNSLSTMEKADIADVLMQVDFDTAKKAIELL